MKSAEQLIDEMIEGDMEKMQAKVEKASKKVAGKASIKKDSAIFGPFDDEKAANKAEDFLTSYFKGEDVDVWGTQEPGSGKYKVRMTWG